MNISKINSTPAFKGFIKFDAKDKKGHYYKAEIDANDITGIKHGYQCCYINTKSGEHKYNYKTTTLWSSRDHQGHVTSIDTVINAYMAAKMSDDDFMIELP